MNTKFEQFKKMAMGEFGLTIKPSDEKLSFEILFGINIEDFKYLETVENEERIHENIDKNCIERIYPDESQR